MPPVNATVANPLDPASVSGTQITVDTWLNNPTRINRALIDLTIGRQRFFWDQVFQPLGARVEGGSVIYDPVQANDLYLSRDVEEVAPGEEFPLVTSQREAPLVARVRKFGGKFYVTDEARDRNNPVGLQREMVKLSNTMLRQMDRYAMAVLNAAITASGRTVAGHDWSADAAVSQLNRTPAQEPGSDIALAQETVDVEEQGTVFDTLILNPRQNRRAMQIYGPNYRQVLRDTYGVTNIYVTNRQVSGRAKLLQSRLVGGFGVEQPIATETWREQETERTWSKTSGRPVFYVDNAFAIVELTGLGA